MLVWKIDFYKFLSFTKREYNRAAAAGDITELVKGRTTTLEITEEKSCISLV